MVHPPLWGVTVETILGEADGIQSLFYYKPTHNLEFEQDQRLRVGILQKTPLIWESEHTYRMLKTTQLNAI